MSDDYDEVELEYDTDTDERLEEAYNAIVAELKNMERTRQWASSKLMEKKLSLV